ncbi:amino acid adenylation domain-containing protein [Paracoccus sp. (in: a-proteobacteria)]|uniref:amino acid adenylation domain-containing protein n=1 Tax=Paracoccus sp. TaxID=267 RepID=UPI002AFF0FB1|nr:amino acid adenylation domain-containing protein [Paracoccus sp. (in: a-proteobacteria)]
MTDLTPMQAAYWAGRKSAGVAAHLYVELDGTGLDPDRLAGAVARLFQRHPMLRMRVTPAGRQLVLPFSAKQHCLAVDDLRDSDPAQIQAALGATRARMAHQALALSDGQAVEFRLSRLSNGQHRLHVDLDMIAADPSCFGRLMDDLARFYRDQLAQADCLQPCYLDLIDPTNDPADRDWWRKTLVDLPDPLNLPAPAQRLSAPHSTNLSARLTADERRRLRSQACAAGVTMSMLALAIFAKAIAQATGQADFRLTVPHFLRPAGHPHGDLMVGDFSGLVVVAVRDALSIPVGDLAQDLTHQVADALSHCGWPGVAAMRDLSRDRGQIEASPVVFTAGFGLPGGSVLTSCARETLGVLGWAVSQGPGVALDVQLAEEGDGLFLNWDIRLDMVDQNWAERAFATHLAALRETAQDVLVRPLGPLAKAYLLGRGDALPLGGVAMQEFREYRGNMPVDAIAARLARVVAAHPALRTRIDPVRVVQYIDDSTAPVAEVIDLGHLNTDSAEAEITRRRDAFAHHVDDLSGPPWALRLYQMPAGAPDATVAFLRFDALILDGLGISRVIHQLFGTDDLTPVAASERPGTNHPTDRAQAEAWWRAQLADVPGPPDLPWRKAPDHIGYSPRARSSVSVPRDDLARLKRIGAKAGLMPNSVLSALILETLARWTPGLALTVAMPVASPAADVLGNHSTFLALGYDACAGTLPDRATQVQRSVAGGLSHLGFSGVDLTRLLLAGGDTRIALPVVLTNGLGWDAPDVDVPMRWTGGLTQTPQVALDIRLSLDASGNLTIAMDYATEALERATIDAMLAAIGAGFDAAAGLDHLPDELPAPAPFTDMPEAPPPYPWLARIADHLADPQAGTALIQNGRAISYAELRNRVRALMAGLRARGITGGKVLAICLPRGADHLALQLAAAFSGVIWVPIDAASPPERLAYLLENCRADLVAGDKGVTLGLPDSALTSDQISADADTIVLDSEHLASLSDHAGPGYYLYTSGTTGRPKCVVLSNQATANVISATCADWRVGPDDRVMSVTPLHHDMSVFDLFGTLSCGATLVMPDTGVDKDATHWAALVAAHRVTIWVSVPAIVEMLLACATDAHLASLRVVAQGGDYIRPATIAALHQRVPDCVLLSLGGPTETVIWSIWHRITPDRDDPVPYGRALPGNCYHILDPLGRPCPVGVTGRIHSSGVNLALGYLKGGTLDQTDFVTLADGARAFRAGDLGRWRADGTILFAGRVDGYVKIRGIRVSLPDIAAHLLRHDRVERVTVVDLPDPVSGEASLRAVYVAPDDPGPAEIRRFLGQVLPASHIPSHLVRVGHLPLTANGKPDRVAARAILSGQADARQPDSSAARVAAVCADILGVPLTKVQPDTVLLNLGLLPRHLPLLARALDGIASETLLRCRTPQNIAERLAR